MSGVTSVEEIYLDPGMSSLVIDHHIDHQTSRVVNGEVVTIPKKPEEWFVWDNATEGWIDPSPLAVLKKKKSDEITLARERRNLSPITYQNVIFDADEEAQRNVSAWMTNIAAGQDPPTGFEWRAYDNVNHPADAAFVVGLGNAITLRGTYLYQRSWIKKAEVAALTTAEDVRAYDVTTGW
jgi:hypothetical protein